MGGALVLALLAGADIVARVAGGIALFAGALEPRERFGRRLALVLAALVAGYSLVLGVALPGAAATDGTGAGASDAGIVAGASGAAPYAAQFVAFSLLLVVCVLAVRLLFRASVWAALFCCSAGYAVQNLASGAAELLWLLLVPGARGLGDVGRMSIPYRVLTWAVTLAVYLAGYLLVTRRASRRGLERVSDRSMLGMMVVVVLMILGLDLVIKALCDRGIPLGYAVALRLAHGGICVFVVWMEYELLVNRRLVEERAATERLLAEHGRQYEASRQSIRAVEARVHDIRHEVLRTLEESGTPLARDTARQVVREIDVFDAGVRTGNEALDTVLTEKSLVCRRAGVTLSCVADGRALAFVAPADLYALFGIALERAIAVERGLPDRDRRSVSVAVRQALGVASVHIECALGEGDAEARAVAEGPEARDDERAVRGIVGRYAGTLATSRADGALRLDAILPLPEDGA